MPHQQKTEEKNTGDHFLSNQRIIVIGASAGGFEAFKKIIKDLPADFDVPIFIVWHMSPVSQSILPNLLSNLNNIPAVNARDNETIKPKHIYVAPPGRHLLIEGGHMKLSHGPKENRFTPAVDPLFRSAAYHYGNKVIGIVLSGGLDDGTAGLWRIKESGGISIVQDPFDAEVASMPSSALREVQVDYCVPVASMAALLVKLCNEKITGKGDVMQDEKTKIEMDIAAEKNAFEKGSLDIGELSPFTYPECHGVLSKITDGNLTRFRCHTGHAYSIDTLVAALSEKIEDSLYNAIRGMDESVLLLNHIGDHLAESNHPGPAALYFKKAKEAMERSALIRKALMSHEQLNNDKLMFEAGENSGAHRAGSSNNA